MAGNDQANNIPRLDESKFNELKDILGDDVRDIIDEFSKIVPNSLETIALSLKSGDADKVFVEAHTLKSSSGNIGLSRFSRLCAILETQARNNKIVEAESQLQLLNDEFPAGVNALNSML
jgi:HPt (histidine-containing phosphotransfer) domain-containing protein